jgi:hypothetical protein
VVIFWIYSEIVSSITGKIKTGPFPVARARAVFFGP